MYKDDWKISNTASLGANWTLVNNSNQRVVSEAALGNATGTSSGYYRYSAGKMSSDHMRIDAQMITPPAGTIANSVNAMLFARMPNTFATSGASGTFMTFIFRQSGNWFLESNNQGSFTTRASGTATFTLPYTVSLVAMKDTYFALLNGSPISGAVWTDSGNSVVGVGSTKRNWGILVQCLATNQQHPGFDWASSHDLAGQFFAAA